MPYDPLMRWETEGGATHLTNGGGPGRSSEDPAQTITRDLVEPRQIEPEDCVVTPFGWRMARSGSKSDTSQVAAPGGFAWRDRYGVIRRRT
jgi:hypothetical protein